MEKELNDLAKKARTIRLSFHERTTVRDAIISYMQTHPVRSEMAARHREGENLVAQRIFSLIHQFILRPMPLALIVLLITGASISYAAEGSLPGDMLYPIKVRVNEEVQGVAKISSKSKASWETQRAQRRLEEAETLASEGKLNHDARVIIEFHLVSHLAAANEAIEALEDESTEGAAEENAEVESSLRAHARVLAQLKEKEQERDTPVTALLEKVHTQLKTTQKTNANITLKVARREKSQGKHIAEAKLRAAERTAREVGNFFEAKRGTLTAEALLYAQAELSGVTDVLAEGKKNLAQEAYGEAFARFQEAHARAGEIRIFIRTQSKLRLSRPSAASDRGSAPSVSPLITVSPSPTPPQSRLSPSPAFTSTPTGGIKGDLRGKIDIKLKLYQQRFPHREALLVFHHCDQNIIEYLNIAYRTQFFYTIVAHNGAFSLFSVTSMLTINDLRPGTFFVYESEPYEALEISHSKVAQRRAVLQTKIRNLRTGNVFQKNFLQSEKFEEADIVRSPITFIYHHRGTYVFSPQGSKERFELDEKKLGDAVRFLKPGLALEAVTYEGSILTVALPIKLDLKVVEAPPGVKGDTAQGGTKAVALESGATIQVPLFIDTGDIVRVNTRTGEYVERVEKAT